MTADTEGWFVHSSERVRSKTPFASRTMTRLTDRQKSSALSSQRLTQFSMSEESSKPVASGMQKAVVISESWAFAHKFELLRAEIVGSPRRTW
jgi:hypothetical protein